MRRVRQRHQAHHAIMVSVVGRAVIGRVQLSIAVFTGSVSLLRDATCRRGLAGRVLPYPIRAMGVWCPAREGNPGDTRRPAAMSGTAQETTMAGAADGAEPAYVTEIHTAASTCAIPTIRTVAVDLATHAVLILI
jgi:hypothetical protein